MEKNQTKQSVKTSINNNMPFIQEDDKMAKEPNKVRFDFYQAVLDDFADEKNEMETILYRSNKIMSLVASLNTVSSQEPKFHKDTYKISLSREIKNVEQLLDLYLEKRLQHNKNQHSIIKRYKKMLKSLIQ